MNFIDKYKAITEKNNSLVCVGIDQADFEKNKAIVEKTFEIVCCYKPNLAFYLSQGSGGIDSLKKIVEFIHASAPEVPVLLDAKFGDVPNTTRKYAEFAFDFLQVDAVTLNPYLGKEALMPFLKREDKGLFILCKTSNEGGGEFQNEGVNTNLLYEYVAQEVATKWNEQNNCMLVVGATYPEELARVRKIAQDTIILIPGVGAQGGDVEKTIKAGLDQSGSGLIISSSRGIVEASDPRQAAIALRDQINSYR